MFWSENLGLSKKEIELRAYEALKLVGLEDEYFYQSPFDLSGGQKRRVAIAGVLAMKPDVLILDEPTAGLDPKGRDEILDQILKLKVETGITVLLVSHSMDDVAKYVDRIIVMNRGSILYDDIPKEVFKHYQELEAIGLAAPQVTYIMKELRDHGYDVSDEITTIEEAKRAIKTILQNLQQCKERDRWQVMLRDITLGQYYQADSVIHRLDPRVKLGTTVLFIISLFLFHGLWGYLVAALFLAFVIKLSKVPFRFMIKGMKSIVFLLSITILFNLFLTPGEPLVQIWILRITKEGVRLALLLAIRLAFLIIGSSVMTLTTTPNQLTDGLERC